MKLGRWYLGENALEWGVVVRIEIPMLPPPQCSPNYHGTVKARIRAVRTWRDAAYYCAVSARNEFESRLEDNQPIPLPWDKSLIKVEFVVPHSGYERDPDNAAAGMKPAIDALVKAGIMPDDKQQHYIMRGPYVWTADKSRAPLTIIEVEEEK